jgi:hypothetical protein
MLFPHAAPILHLRHSDGYQGERRDSPIRTPRAMIEGRFSIDVMKSSSTSSWRSIGRSGHALQHVSTQLCLRALVLVREHARPTRSARATGGRPVAGVRTG